MNKLWEVCKNMPRQYSACHWIVYADSKEDAINKIVQDSPNLFRSLRNVTAEEIIFDEDGVGDYFWSEGDR